MISKQVVLTILSALVLLVSPTTSAMAESQVVVKNVRQVFDNGEHNAFTDLIVFQGRFYLTFRSCPDGHMVHPTASIVVLSSTDLKQWDKVHQFSVPLRDTRDPHFLAFDERLFIYTGTWYCGETSPDRSEYDLNLHLGYAVFSEDGQEWSSPQVMEGTFGHYVWRAAEFGGKAYLCGRRKHQFDTRPRGEGPNVESAMLVSDDGLNWKHHSLFQSKRGDETAFRFDASGSLTAVARRGRDAAELLRSKPPFQEFSHTDLGEYIGGPLLTKWAGRTVVGGRNQTPEGPRTVLHWLDGGTLVPFAQLPSGGDNSYPGFIALSRTQAVVSWYSSHEKTANGQTKTAIYMADLELTDENDELPQRKEISFASSLDQTEQRALLSIPDMPADPAPLPIVVSLHSWSGDMHQRQPALERMVRDRGWFFLQPNFRGINQTPEACGSPLAQQDIIDAIDRVQDLYPIDPERIYLTGNSGGGHMTMMMAAKFPERWAAASAWVGISDMKSWYTKHANGKYGAMMRKCCGGAPDDSAEVAEQYHLRSPKFYLESARDVPLEIAAGIHDGHTGSVPIAHSIEAFNVIASANGTPGVSQAESVELSRPDGRLSNPTDSDEGYDPFYGRRHYLRRSAGRARLTIFEGGHEGIASAAMAWFDQHPRKRQD